MTCLAMPCHATPRHATPRHATPFNDNAMTKLPQATKRRQGRTGKEGGMEGGRYPRTGEARQGKGRQGRTTFNRGEGRE